MGGGENAAFFIKAGGLFSAFGVRKEWTFISRILS